MCLRFRLAFESKVAEVASAQARLNVLTQRLAFAKGRVETVQGTTLAGALRFSVCSLCDLI